MLGARPIPPAAGEDLEIVRPDKIVPGRQIRNELWGGPNHPHPAGPISTARQCVRQAEIALFAVLGDADMNRAFWAIRSSAERARGLPGRLVMARRNQLLNRLLHMG